MKEAAPTGQLASLLDRFAEIGGVVEHVLISPDRPGPLSEVDHRAAALFTLGTIARGVDAHFERVLQMREYRHRRRSEFFSVNVNRDLLIGRQISSDEFLGPWWDRANRKLVRDRRCVRGIDMSGYAFAFFDPPYSLYDRRTGARVSDTEAAELFAQITDLLFAGFAEALVAYAWSTDCSNYFDAGREWWGGFFWTAEVPGSGRIVGVAASSTD